MKIAVLGANGRMGRRVVRLIHDAPDLTLCAALGRADSAALGTDIGVLAGVGEMGVRLGAKGLGGAEVVIDFALPEATLDVLSSLGGIPLVTGVTGLDPEQHARLHTYEGPLLHAANFSTGVNVLIALVERAAAALPDHDIEVIEAHHGRKRDAPSGTALFLARAAAEVRGVDLEAVRADGRQGSIGERPTNEIGLHAIRAGGIIGEHEVWFASNQETVKLCHSAASRDTFAAGAIRAARWIRGRAPGRYTMRQVLDL